MWHAGNKAKTVGPLDLNGFRAKDTNLLSCMGASGSSRRSKKDDYHDSECAWTMAFGVCMDNVRAAWEPGIGSESPLMVVLIEMICIRQLPS